jgi:hypothetical protein
MVGLDQGGLESHLSFLFFFAARIRLFRFLFLGLRNGTRGNRQFAESAMCFSWMAKSVLRMPIGLPLFLWAAVSSVLRFFCFLGYQQPFCFCCALSRATASCRCLGLEVEQLWNMHRLNFVPCVSFFL